MRRTLLPFVTTVLLLLAGSALVAQQGGGAAPPLAGQSLRPYGYVFVAYAIAWLLVFGWAFSIARRLARVERRLEP